MPTPGMSSTQFVQFGPDGFLYVTDYFSQRIFAFDVATGELKKMPQRRVLRFSLG